MTLTSPAPPLSDPRARAFQPARCGLMTVVRVAVLVAAFNIYGATISPTADALGAGLVGFMIIFSLAGLWAIIDGWRCPLPTAAVAWLVTALLFTGLSPLPMTITSAPLEGGWTGLPDYIASVTDTAGVIVTLVLLPAAVGLGLGCLIRRLSKVRLARTAD